MSHTRRTYTGEFKREAVELALVGKKTMAELERDLGLSKGLLKQWVRKARAEGEVAFGGQGRLKPQAEEIRRLRRENEILRQARDILKKAVAIFSQVPNRSSSS